MKILLINEVCGVTSTGTICADLAEYLSGKGHEVRVLYGRMDAPDRCRNYGIRIAGKNEVRLSALSSRLFDNCGLNNRYSTLKAIKCIREFSPDIIHLHNLHGYYINYKILFEELERLGIPVVYTLHDCWALTGHCAYFDKAGCYKWKNGCGKCPQKGEYPKSLFIDRSAVNIVEKKTAYNRLKKMKVVVPSMWLRGIVAESVFGRDAVVIPNGINTDIFRHKEENYFRKNKISDKKVVLGVASLWEDRKGLSYFVQLSKKLSDDYCIVLVGVNDNKANLPDNIITIPRTSDRTELASIYSSAYVYLNPTLEDNYPTTNLESICCGTPVITFDTGGSPESASYYGIISEKNVDSIMEAINCVGSLPSDCIEEARAFFDSSRMMKQYENLYLEMIDSPNRC